MRALWGAWDTEQVCRGTIVHWGGKCNVHWENKFIVHWGREKFQKAAWVARFVSIHHFQEWVEITFWTGVKRGRSFVANWQDLWGIRSHTSSGTWRALFGSSLEPAQNQDGEETWMREPTTSSRHSSSPSWKMHPAPQSFRGWRSHLCKILWTTFNLTLLKIVLYLYLFKILILWHTLNVSNTFNVQEMILSTPYLVSPIRLPPLSSWYLCNWHSHDYHVWQLSNFFSSSEFEFNINWQTIVPISSTTTIVSITLTLSSMKSQIQWNTPGQDYTMMMMMLRIIVMMVMMRMLMNQILVTRY